MSSKLNSSKNTSYKQVSIRLYRRHDIDLISLYKNPELNFKAAILMTLNSYAKGESLLFLPAESNIKIKEYKYMYQIFIKIDRAKYTDVINLLDNVKEGYRTIFIKSVLRGTLIGTNASACLKNNDNSLDKINTAIKDKMISESFGAIDFPKKKKYMTKSNKPSRSADKKRNDSVNKTCNSLITNTSNDKSDTVTVVDNKVNATENNVNLTNDNNPSTSNMNIQQELTNVQNNNHYEPLPSEDEAHNPETDNMNTDDNSYEDVDFSGFSDNIDASGTDSDDGKHSDSSGSFNMFDDINAMMDLF